MASITSINTPFDRALLKEGGVDFVGDVFSDFSFSENRGKALYMEHCHSCHGSLYSPPLIFEANNGLENPYTDPGKGAISGLFYERGVFRVPGLRNITVSGPYMHDGRFGSLMEVIEHYDSGIQAIFGLHGDLLVFNEASQSYSPKRLQLTASDKVALVDFLYTLEDSYTLTDPRFSDPFRR
jgi:cytochrome c peroxidase